MSKHRAEKGCFVVSARIKPHGRGHFVRLQHHLWFTHHTPRQLRAGHHREGHIADLGVTDILQLTMEAFLSAHEARYDVREASGSLSFYPVEGRLSRSHKQIECSSHDIPIRISTNLRLVLLIRTPLSRKKPEEPPFPAFLCLTLHRTPARLISFLFTEAHAIIRTVALLWFLAGAPGLQPAGLLHGLGGRSMPLTTLI